MKFTLEIELRNNETGEVVAEALRHAASTLMAFEHHVLDVGRGCNFLRGANGQVAGNWEVMEDPHSHAFKTGLCNLCHKDELHPLHAADLAERIAENERRDNNREGHHP